MRIVALLARVARRSGPNGGTDSEDEQRHEENKMKTKLGADLVNGDRVIIEGHRFTVRNPKLVTKEDGTLIVRFVGTTDEASLIETSYNGGIYGRNADMTYPIWG